MRALIFLSGFVAGAFSTMLLIWWVMGDRGDLVDLTASGPGGDYTFRGWLKDG